MSDERIAPREQRTRPWSKTAAAPLPADAGFTPWERWAYDRIALGEQVDMADFPRQGGALAEEAGVERGAASNRNVDAPLQDWPRWQQLSERFLRTILFHEPWSTTSENPEVTISNAYIKDDIQWSGREFQGSLTFDKCRFADFIAWVFCKFDKVIQFSESRFDSFIWIIQSKIGNSAIFIKTRVAGDVSLNSSYIGGNLVVTDSEFNTRERKTHELDENSFRMFGLTVAMNVTIEGSRFHRPLNGASMKIGGGLDITKEAHLMKGADLIGLQIGNDLVIEGSRLEGKLTMQRARIGAAVYIRANSLVHAIDFTNAVIEGECQFVAGRYRVGDHRKHSAVTGAIEFFGARVKSELLLSSSPVRIGADAADQDDEVTEIDGQPSVLTGHAPPCWTATASLSLREVEVGAFRCDLGAFRLRQANGEEPARKSDRGYVTLDLTGFQAGRFSGHDSEGGRSLASETPRELVAWIQAGAAAGRFSPGPYRMLAEGLEHAGERAKARHVLRALGAHEARCERNVALSLIMRLSGVLIGYGYGTWRAAFWFALLVAGFAAVGMAWDPAANWQSGADWRAWGGYALDNAVPLFEITAAGGDHVAARFPDGPPPWFGFAFSVEGAIGLAIISFVIAGLAGWARSRAGG